jgi:aspartate/methionine/tyrosine aminotransferase
LEIGKLAEKHDLIVISDEIYDRLVYGVNHICFASCRVCANVPFWWAVFQKIMP